MGSHHVLCGFPELGSALCQLRICTHSSTKKRAFPQESRPLRALMEADLISHACGEMVHRNIRKLLSDPVY